jgi:hypothetical protein
MPEKPRDSLERTTDPSIETASGLGASDAGLVTQPEVVQEAGVARLETLDHKRNQELSELNVVRANLGLPPAETSVAIASLDEERDKLATTQYLDVVGHTENTHAGLPSRTIERQSGELSPLVPGLEESFHISKPIRSYFEELGPEETIRRFQEGGPALANKMLELIRGGNLHETVWTMERFSPEAPNARNNPRMMESVADMDEAYHLHAMRTIDKIERLRGTGDGI